MEKEIQQGIYVKDVLNRAVTGSLNDLLACMTSPANTSKNLVIAEAVDNVERDPSKRAEDIMKLIDVQQVHLEMAKQDEIQRAIQ